MRRVAIPNSQALSLLGREIREAHLQVLLGGGTFRSGNSTSSSGITDLLSSLALNFPGSEAEEISKVAASTTEDTSKKVMSTKIWKKR